MNPAYPLIMLLAVASGALVSRLTQQGLSIARRDKCLIGLAAFCGAMIGAKLPFLLADLTSVFRGEPWYASGKTIMCGLVGGYFSVEFAKWYLGVQVKTGDSFAVPVAVSVGVGRWACFAGGCCYGTPTEAAWGVVFAHVDLLPRHPTQVYESLFHLTMAAVLWRLFRLQLLRGQLMKLYILSYLGYRFLTEFIRPEPEMAAGLTGYQWAALVIAPLFVWLWSRDAGAMTISGRGSLDAGSSGGSV